MDNVKVVWVGGTGRCGTTILKDVIHQHPQIAGLPFRHRFIIDPGGLMELYSALAENWSPFIANRAVRDFWSLLLNLCDPDEEPYKGWNLLEPFPNLFRYWDMALKELGAMDYKAPWVGGRSEYQFSVYPHSPEYVKRVLGQFIMQNFGSVMQAQGASVFVDGDTWNMLYADKLLSLVPRSVFIHIVRDPRDVVASMVKQPWCPKEEIQTVKWYNSLMDRWMQIKGRLDPLRYVQIRLEDMLDNPEDHFRLICTLAGVDYSPELASSRLSGEMSHSGRWEKELSKDAVIQLRHYTERLKYK